MLSLLYAGLHAVVSVDLCFLEIRIYTFSRTFLCVLIYRQWNLIKYYQLSIKESISRAISNEVKERPELLQNMKLELRFREMR